MLEAQPQDKRGELYLFPNPQKRVAISGAAGVCGKSSPPRKEKKNGEGTRRIHQKPHVP